MQWPQRPYSYRETERQAGGGGGGGGGREEEGMVEPLGGTSSVISTVCRLFLSLKETRWWFGCLGLLARLCKSVILLISCNASVSRDPLDCHAPSRVVMAR